MGWNEPNKNNNSPWRDKNQPPDLDEVFKRLQEKIKKMFFFKSLTNTGGSRPTNNTSRSPLALLISIAIFILWVLSGIFIVDPAEQAAILRFGRYIETVGPGPHWIPRFISSKIILNVDRVSDYSYAGHMLTKDENLVSVSLAVQYRIGDLEEYLFNVADPIENLQQATSSALRQVVGTTTLDQLITEGRDAWGSSVQDSLIKILSRYKTGIVIVNVSPQPARAPENVQDAFDDAIKAQEDERRFKEQARAYEASVVPTAEGGAKRIFAEAQAYASQVVLQAKGEVAEFLSLLPEYKRAPYVTGERMYIDTMQRVLSLSSKILVDNKSNNILYLPIERLREVVDVTKQNKIIAPSVDTQSSLQSDSPLTFGRETTRPVERQGRTG